MHTEILSTDPGSSLFGGLIAPVKEHLRVYHEDDDDKIIALLDAAVQYTESITRPMVNQTMKHYFTAWETSFVLLQGLDSVNALKYINSTDTEVTVATSDYYVDKVSGSVTMINTPSAALSLHAKYPISIETVYKPANVPEYLRLAVKVLTAHFYENPDIYVVGQTVNEVPDSYQALITNYRNMYA